MGACSPVPYVLVVACFLFLSGIFLPRLLQLQLEQGIRTAVVWRPDSPPEVDARYRSNAGTNGTRDFVEVFLFNITNVAEIRNGSRPKLEEVGPFTYAKVKRKIYTWWDRAGGVEVKEWDYYVPVPGLVDAPAPSTAIVTTLNMALIGVVEGIHAAYGPSYARWLDWVAYALAEFSDGHVDGLFTRRSAHELIWGYDDLFLSRLSRMLPAGTIPTTRVELLHNASEEETLAAVPTVFDTGGRNVSAVWNTLSDAGHTEATCWNGCTERVTGTDGTQFHPSVRPSDVLKVWVPQVYRSQTFLFESEVQWDGVRFLRFTTDPADFAVDACHFQELRGLMNLTTPHAVGINGTASAAAGGPPLYLSRPHFCGCDASLASGVDGLACNESRHRTWIDVEPITGITMRGHTSMMASSEMTPTARAYLEPKIARTNNKSVIIPIFFFEEHAGAGDADVVGFREGVYWVLALQRAFSHFVLPAGAALLALGLIALVVTRLGLLPAAVSGSAGRVDGGTDEEGARREGLLQGGASGAGAGGHYYPDTAAQQRQLTHGTPGVSPAASVFGGGGDDLAAPLLQPSGAARD
ncbi:hypothetical protein FOA52_004935 [Chlamydomonas sp. UWO 241]|nr:hypothetical protein FOA52_004935 [Chlamydomonas sp. UWO 241]